MFVNNQTVLIGAVAEQKQSALLAGPGHEQDAAEARGAQ
jgi:hypothetical protein